MSLREIGLSGLIKIKTIESDEEKIGIYYFDRMTDIEATVIVFDKEERKKDKLKKISDNLMKTMKENEIV